MKNQPDNTAEAVTIEQIKDQVADEQGKINFSSLMHNYGGVTEAFLNVLMERYAHAKVKEALERVSNLVSGIPEEPYKQVAIEVAIASVFIGMFGKGDRV